MINCMSMIRTHSSLGLGGHSFIEELGNDPAASFAEQCEIVSACLNSGVRIIDTTYYQERVALGKVLAEIGRREEAEILAWNFFSQAGKENELVDFTPYEPEHIDVMLRELQTSYIDVLVIHVHGDRVKFGNELELAESWIMEGKVKKAALGMAQLRHLNWLPDTHPISYVLAPYNAFQQDAAELFEAAKSRGMTTVALSPFIRGWKLDEIAADKNVTADILLRWVAHQPNVDHVIASMRKKEWVVANLHALERGPIHKQDQKLLDSWIDQYG